LDFPSSEEKYHRSILELPKKKYIFISVAKLFEALVTFGIIKSYAQDVTLLL
jgi:hypothetical protein